MEEEQRQAPTQKPVINSQHKSGVSKHTLLTIVAIFFISIASGFTGGLIGVNYKSNSTSTTERIEQGRQVIEEQGDLISSIAKEVGPSVVSIDVTSRGEAESFFGPRTFQQQSAGTGFIISESGYVVTNRHVIAEGVTQVSLTMSDGTILDEVAVVGRTAGSDPLDVAFLKINNTKGKKLTVARLGDSGSVEVGDTVIAIGNALGQFQNSVTSGIISGYGRSVEASDGRGANAENLQNLFQTDAAINQGNSGGPLVNSNGEVIGINTAVAGGSAQNIGFAIPINDTKGLIQGVLENGRVQRPYLGVRYIQITPGNAEELGVSVDEGAYVGGVTGTGIVVGSPAQQAGLQDKDVIIKVNGQPVDQNNTLASVIGRFKVGEEVEITYLRGGQERTTKVTLGELPAN